MTIAAGLAAWQLAGCAIAVEDGAASSDDEVASVQEGLFMTGPAWTNGQVNVCYDYGSDPALLDKTRKILANSWEKAANVTFNGFNMCTTFNPHVSNPWVRLSFAPGRGHAAGVGMPYQPYNVQVVSDDTSDPKQAYLNYTVIHEFGHVLGFAHEQERPDNWNADGTFQYCDKVDPTDEKLSGTKLTSFYDTRSVMNYCAGNPILLSGGDIDGIRQAYGRSPSAHGFRILSGNGGFGWKVSGAGEGVAVRLAANCSNTDPECTWSYRDGMILSDADPTLAVRAWGGAADGASLRLTRSCRTVDSNCTWSWSQGEFLSDSNSMAVGAVGGSAEGTRVALQASCTPSNGDCMWALANVMLQSEKAPTMAIYPYKGAQFGHVLTMSDSCSVTNPDCTFTFKWGMILSDRDPNLRVNAWGGASDGGQVALHNECIPQNPACLWRWRHGNLETDDSQFSLRPNGYSNGSTVSLVAGAGKGPFVGMYAR